MPWTAQSFAARHNADLSSAQATIAARIANAILRKTGDEGKAIRVANAQAEGEAKAQESSDATAQVQALQQQFTQAIQEIVKGLTANKSITMKMPDGRTATAQVAMQ